MNGEQIHRGHMDSRPSVAVLMSTYNGEEYIQEQIDSILSQDSVDVCLYVRDDGSTDSTVDIVRTYAKQGHVRLVPGMSNRGPANSFMLLLYSTFDNTDADYFAFADQDDVWKPDKLIRAIERLRNRKTPALYCSNQIVFDGKNEMGLRFSEIPTITLESILFRNDVSGCTMVFNRELAAILCKDSSRPHEQVLSMRMHDVWVLLVALLHGDVFYDPDSRICYRIHQSNAVGVRNDAASPIKRARLIASSLKNKTDVRYRSAYARELLLCFPDMDEAQKEKVGKLANYSESLNGKIKLIRDGEMQKYSGCSKFSYAAKAIMGTL